MPTLTKIIGRRGIKSHIFFMGRNMSGFPVAIISII